jgi:hypothetical protein
MNRGDLVWGEWHNGDPCMDECDDKLVYNANRVRYCERRRGHDGLHWCRGFAGASDMEWRSGGCARLVDVPAEPAL